MGSSFFLLLLIDFGASFLLFVVLTVLDRQSSDINRVWPETHTE